MSTAPEALEGIFVRMKTEDIDRKLIGRFIRLTAIDEK